MRSRKRPALPARLERGRQRFERWRRTRRRRAIPEELWAAAVKLADAYGVHRTAQALRLNYYSLKKRIQTSRTARRRGVSEEVPGVEAAPAFVEVIPAGLAGASNGEVPEWLVELEDGSGRRMRLRARGSAVPTLTELARCWSRKP